MKKFYIIAAMALASATASAQQTLSLSTYAGTNIAKYDGQIKNVSVNRYVFNGWNTISLPFSMTKEEVCAAFGTDCRLETLVGVENKGNDIILNFQDCKNEGIKANTPYILYFNGENQNIKFLTPNARITDAQASVSFVDSKGVRVTFAATQAQRDAQGLYGILAKDNSEASFVNVDNIATNGFYATRCYVQLSSGTNATLIANHIGEGDITALASVMKTNEKADVYNVSGVKVASAMSINDINRLNAGIYVVKGKKIAVK